MGRLPKPDNRHEIEGTKNRSARKSVKPTPLPAEEWAETWMASAPAATARRAYSAANSGVETAEALNTLGIGSEADRGLVEAYAAALGLFRDAAEQIKAEGLVIEDRDGNARKHPLLATVNQTQTQIRNLGVRLGLDPGSRAGLEVNAKTAASGSIADQFSEYL